MHVEAYKSYLKFHIKDPSTGPDFLISAQTLQVKPLPHTIDRNSLFDLFRTHGPLYSCKLHHGRDGIFKGQAQVQFFEEAAAQEAIKALVSCYFLFCVLLASTCAQN
jgi:RNA recognition motif-containing protein